MKRRMLSLLLIAVVVLGMLPTTVLAAPAQNGGIYQISTAEDLLWFAQKVNAGGTGIKGMLTADIDLSDVSDWPGIGTTSNPFSGTFDGQGYTVTFKDSNVGLFGVIMGSRSNLATIENVVTAGSIKNAGFAAVAGFVQFRNCINRATITSAYSRLAKICDTVIEVTAGRAIIHKGELNL